MADFEIIEADFQQYYNLDVSRLGFRRYARLLLNLPVDSRFISDKVDSKDWNWDKEVQSRILYTLDAISCQISNMNRKKGTKPRKPSDQFQPDYVTEAKKKIQGKGKLTKEEKEDLEAFFSRRNNKINNLERNNNGQESRHIL